MTDEINETIEEIFFQAMRHGTLESREDFLSRACAGNPEMRREVDALLAAESSPDSFLDRPIDLAKTSAGGEAALEVTEGQVIGRYKLLQQLGEGGFGVVYMAEQSEPVRRKVALKVIKPGMDSKEVIARFEAERQALALMEHTNIAKILDAGTTASGRPYFVMDLVKGVSLSEYCDTNNLSTRDRLLLFVQVCRAVQHAHQKGIIHRDLKPANVMVTLHDGVPIPKVIDFGVSKALCQQLTEKTLFTRYGQIVGTPQYMSPEQAEMSGLDVDTRSDIYSLGVLLYELLTGRPPFDSERLRDAGFEEMRRLIREQEPVKPSTRLRTLDGQTATIVASHRSSRPETLQKVISGDLDWIVMKALDKDRSRRYETAASLLNDVERHLNDEPVNAGPPTFSYQLMKVIRRHRVATSVMAAISATVLLALCVTTIAWNQAVVAVQEKDEALTEKDNALSETENQRRIAESSAAEAKRQAENAQLAADNAQQSLKLVKDLLGEASPSIERGKDATVRELLDEFSARLAADPPQKNEVEIEVRLLLGSAYKSFSEFEKASQQFDRVEILARTTYDTQGATLARLLFELAQAKERGSQEVYRSIETGAGGLLLEALEICKTGNADKPLQVDILTQLGLLAGARNERSEDYFKQACNLADTLPPESRKDLKENPYRIFARMLNVQGRRMDAASFADRALQLSREQNQPDELAASQMLLSDMAWSTSLDDVVRHADLALQDASDKVSAQTLRDALVHRLEIEFSRYDLQPLRIETLRKTATDSKRRLQNSWNRLINVSPGRLVGSVAGALFVAGDERDALETIAMIRNLPGDQQNAANYIVAQWLRRHGELRQAHQYYAQRDDTFPLIRPWPIANHARAYFGARDFPSGLTLLGQAIEWLDEVGITDQWDYAFIQFERAILLRSLGRQAEARRLFADADARLSRSTDHLWGDITPSIHLLSKLFSDEEDPEIQELAARVERLDASPWPLPAAMKHAALGQLALGQGDVARATAQFVLAMQNRPGQFEQVNMEWVNDQVVELLTDQGDIERLEKLLREDVERRDKHVGRNHPERAYVRIRLVSTLVKHNRNLDDAPAMLAEAKRVYGYHGDFIPAVEHDKLVTLIESVDTKAKVRN